MVENPDLDDINNEYFSNWRRLYDFSKLEEPTRNQARIISLELFQPHSLRVTDITHYGYQQRIEDNKAWNKSVRDSARHAEMEFTHYVWRLYDLTVEAEALVEAPPTEEPTTE